MKRVTALGIVRNEWRLRFAVGLAAAGAFACTRDRGKTRQGADAVPSVAVAVVDSGPAVSSSAPRTSASPSSYHATVALEKAIIASENEERTRSGYLEALKRGRSATAAHRYDDAVAAFSDAIEHRGGFGSARAHAERGYAYLLAKRYALAEHDFEQASDMPADSTLASQIWFNMGLTERASGHERESDLAFYWANRLSPSKAAADAIAGKKVCPLVIDRQRVAAHPYPGWQAWAKSMDEHARRAEPSLTGRSQRDHETEAQTHERLCHDCTGDGPWAVDFGRDPNGPPPQEWDTHVLSFRDGTLWDFGVVGMGAIASVPSGAGCYASTNVTLAHVGPLVIGRVVSESRAEGKVLAVLDARTHVAKPCPDEDLTSTPASECNEWCLLSAATETYYVFDVGRGVRLMSVRQEAHFPMAELAPPFEVTVEPGPEAFDVSEAACGELPYDPP